MPITREILHPNFSINGMPKEEFHKLTNSYKRLFAEKYKLKKGDKVAIAIFTIDADHLAALLGAAELGLVWFTMSKPISKETLHMTKMGLFGPVDLTLVDRHWIDTKYDDNGLPLPLWDMLYQYSHAVCSTKEIEEMSDEEYITPYVITDEDPIFFTTTSGTTGISKPVISTHHTLSGTIASCFLDFYPSEGKFFQGQNLHHGAGIGLGVMPGIHRYAENFAGDQTIITGKTFVEDFCIDRGVSVALVFPMMFDEIFEEVEKNIERIDHRITLIAAGWPSREDHYNISKKLPIDFVWIYGSAETGSIFIDNITSDTEYFPGRLGKMLPHIVPTYEDGYLVSVLDTNQGYSATLEDKIKFDGVNHIFEGRIIKTPQLPENVSTIIETLVGGKNFTSLNVDDKFDVVIWDKDEPIDFSSYEDELKDVVRKFVYLPISRFIGANKLDMEQLRAFVAHEYKMHGLNLQG